MNKILLGKNWISRECLKTQRTYNRFQKYFSKDTEKKDDNEGEVDDKYKARKGLLHDKQQSVQEESYFHREELELLKQLKKKIFRNKRKPQDDEKNKKED